MDISSIINDSIKEIMRDLSPEEQDEVLKILGEYKTDGYSQSLNNLYEEDFDEIPVDIDTFIEDDRYIGKFTGNGSLIYNYWREKQREMFEDSDQYQEIALTGAIGTGKSTIACIGMSYLLYKTMCLKDPQKYYRLAAGSTIVFAFFNNTLDLSTSVGYGTVQNIVQSSPWFLERGKVSGTKYKEYTPDKLIRFRVGSTAGHALGTNIICAMIDEVNFKQGANVRMEQSKIMETYNGVLERMGSRFMVNGKIAGKLFIVSSKKSEYDFLESYIRKKKDDPSVLVCDAKLWEVKPMGTYSGKTFRVAVGGSNMPSRIIPDDEEDEYYLKQGYEIIEPPLEFKGRFEMDIQAALMNIAGISISHVTKFITYDNINKCYCKSKNPFSTNIITIGMKDSLAIKDFFNPTAVPPEIYTMPIFIHEDMSLTGDRTGIGAVAAMGYKYQNVYDIESGETVPTKAIVYRHVFSIGIQCPSGDEISFQKSRDFIYYLKHELGWNIKALSADSYQSADNKQQFITMGFKDSSIISLDRKPDGYLALRSAINEKRIALLNIPELETELIRLERDNMTGKVDHPPDGCFSYDTKILLVDSKGIRHDICIGEITDNYDKYKDYRVVSINDSGSTILTGYINPRVTKKVDSLLEIELDNGKTIRCTHNHPFLCIIDNDYKYIRAEELTEDIEIVEPFEDMSKSIEYLRSQGLSDRKIFNIMDNKFINLYINEGFSLGRISSNLGVSKTSLNNFMSVNGIKRTKTEAFMNARDQNLNLGSVTKIKEDPEYRERVRQLGREQITKYNKSEKAKLEKSNRVISEETRKKLRNSAIERWSNEEYVSKISNSKAGNSKYGIHQEYYSDKFDRRYYLKSDTERLLLELLEKDTSCTDVEYESVRIRYSYEDRDHIYIPDFLVYINGVPKYIIEVKYNENHYKGLNKVKYDAGIKYCKDNSLIFVWLRRKDLEGFKL